MFSGPNRQISVHYGLQFLRRETIDAEGSAKFRLRDKRLMLLTDGPSPIQCVTDRENEGTFYLSATLSSFNTDSLPL
jgi:hypothetical protein